MKVWCVLRECHMYWLTTPYNEDGFSPFICIAIDVAYRKGLVSADDSRAALDFLAEAGMTGGLPFFEEGLGFYASEPSAKCQAIRYDWLLFASRVARELGI